MMKVHSFVRENAQYILRHRKLSFTDDDESDSSKPKGIHVESDETNVPPCPGFSSYLYFLFCPSLIYRNEYPRCVHNVINRYRLN